MFDIIALIVVVVISIVTAAAKKKSAAARKSGTPPASGPVDDDPWKTFREMFEGVGSEGETPPAVQPDPYSVEEQERKIFSYEDFAVERMERGGEGIESYEKAQYPVHPGQASINSRLPDSGRSDEGIYARGIANNKEVDGRLHPADKAGEASVGDISQDFNIRTAILYSEILKPKFKE